MANLNQSTMSANAFPLQPSSDLSVSSHVKRKATWPRTAVVLAAGVEIIVGATFLLAFNAQAQLVFGATPEEIVTIFARFVGIALIGLGISCLPSKVAGTNRNPMRGLLLFNIAATILFAWAALATTLRGVIAWPVVILHAGISIALALSLRHEDS